MINVSVTTTKMQTNKSVSVTQTMVFQPAEYDDAIVHVKRGLQCAHLGVRRKMSATKTAIQSAREGLQTRQASHPNRRIAFSMEPHRSVVNSGEFGVAPMWARLGLIPSVQVTRVLLTSRPNIFATNGRP